MSFGMPSIEKEIKPFLDRLDKLIEVLERMEAKLDNLGEK